MDRGAEIWELYFSILMFNVEFGLTAVERKNGKSGQ